MAGGLEGRSSATRGVEQAIVALKKGAHLLKCGKRGNPKLCFFRLSYVHSLYGSPRLVQNNVWNSSLDCSESSASPRQRTLSDLDFYLERIAPEMVNTDKNSLRDARVADKIKEQRITQMPKLKSSEGSHVAYGTDSRKDIFFWGDVLGSVLDHGGASKANVSLPRLLNSTHILDVQNVACGEKHAAVVTKQGEVFSWGKESGERLGHKAGVGVSHPEIIDSLAFTRVKTIAFGAKHACALAVSGELYEWGEGAHRLCLGDDQCHKSQWFPYKLYDPLDGISVLKISCGQWHTAIISSSGQLFTYGDGTFGVLGHGDTKSVARPKEVESLKGVRAKAVACGPWHTAAIVEILGNVKSNAPSGKLFTWGDADRRKLGHADDKLKLVPTCVKPLTDVDFAQVTTLAEQCRHRSLKVQSYKRKVEETWLIVRNEAAKSKAAKDIIKVLTNKRNALSKKISAGEQSYNSETIPSRITNGVKAELPDPPDKTPVTGKSKPSGIRDHHEQLGRECIQSKNTATANDSTVHRNGRREPNNSYIYAGETVATVHPIDSYGTVEQISRGVYVTIVTSPGGNKGLKRIRFSRKHFGEKEAQKWWEANKSRLFAKYSCMEQMTG
ncbi:hypothetical protein ACQ4PT_065430 [Festuca glaucescens]